MTNITVRNIPDPVMERVRAMATLDRRSVNSELLVLIERGIGRDAVGARDDLLPSADAQLGLWERLCGSWEDSRTAEEISADIQAHRTLGREVDL